MYTFVFIFLITSFLYRICLVFNNLKYKYRQCINGKTIKTLIFMGSGGHTSEMEKVLSEFDFTKYTPRYYLIANTDIMSLRKIQVIEDESDQNVNYYVHFVPRSREVGQSWFSTIFTTLYSFLHSAFIVLKFKPNLILCNGPGSCVPVCLAAFLFKVLYIMDIKIVFIESICRVKSLSLSGKILYYFCDEFFVHWPSLYKKYPEAQYLGKSDQN